MLRVIKRLKDASPLSIKSTFLGAHAIPVEYKDDPDAYVDLVINEMIPQVAAEELADYIDVFCDRGFFSVEQTEKILMAGIKYGMRPKIHANELDYSGGIQAGVNTTPSRSITWNTREMKKLKPCWVRRPCRPFCPVAAFFLNMIYAPARKMIDAGLPLCLASDFNPGSSPSGNMQLILSMGSILYRMLPEEGINATTINGAYAMDLSDELGSIAVGKRAECFYHQRNSRHYEFMPYYYGANKVDSVILNGRIVKGNIQ
ncbi:MAG: amidohydrolase family protein [Bacteroidota bacterium]|nr:amidohydrolase family protein [Bacteroidota bacterium]